MMGLNKVLLIGHVGAKPEVRRSQAGEPVARLRLATSTVHHREGSEQKDTEWHDVVAFGKTAEVIEQFVDKGRLLYVEGRIASHAWEDKTGTKRFTREVIARRLDLLGPKPQAA